MIKNIVFDMGNVLVRFDPELFMDRYSLTGEDRKLIRNEVFRSVEWTMLDRGVIDEEIAEQRILPRLPERLHDAARGLIEKWDDPIVPVEGMLELLQALKAKGYRLYLLSNAATRQPIYWARAEASKLMDGALISAEVKLLKPDPQIYRTFLRKFALRPEECVFIDDTPINVEGALYENMAGIVFNMDVAALAQLSGGNRAVVCHIVTSQNLFLSILPICCFYCSCVFAVLQYMQSTLSFIECTNHREIQRS